MSSGNDAVRSPPGDGGDSSNEVMDGAVRVDASDAR